MRGCIVPPPILRRAGRRVTVAACLMALGPALPLAGIGERNGELGADYALQRFDPALERGTGGRLSLRGGRHATDRFQWEGQVTRGDIEDEALPGAVRKVTLTFALVNVVLNFHPRRNVVPYVLAGLGLARTKLEAVGLTASDTDTGYQIGGGSRFFFGSRSAVALRLELSVLGHEAFEDSYFHPSVAAGLTFRVGREPT